MAGLALVIVVAGCWSVSRGDFPVPLREVAHVLTGGGEPDARFVVATLRLPRVLVGIAAGGALGLSGALFQSLVRNPLGSPDVVGFTSGSAVGAVVAISVLGVSSAAATTVASLVGGLVVAGVVGLAAWRGGLHLQVLVLAGIGMGVSSRALVDLLLTRADINDAQRAMVWLIGSLNGRTWDDVNVAAGGFAVFGAGALALAPAARALEHGDDLARAWGWHAERTRVLVALAGLGLAATATAAAGPIGFVALLAPPIARRITATSTPCLLPAAGVGATITVAADAVGRLAVPWIDLPVGITTSMVGAPYLGWLLLGHGKVRA